MLKKIFYSFLVIAAIICLPGCGAAEQPTSVSDPVVPSNAIMKMDGNEIELPDITLSLPDGMSYGKKETEYGTSYYIWKSETDCILPSSADVLLYIYQGNDKKSPDLELKDSEARSSMEVYIQDFMTDSEDARISFDAGMTNNDEWYTLCFTGYGGSTNEVTTYGVYCYPKSFYGMYLLQKNVAEDYSRNYYGFVFSNDGKGDIFTEDEYNSLFSQVKDGFGIKEFFSMQQLNYDASQDFSKGYSYTQFKDLFKNTTNYYIITGNRKPEQDDTTSSEVSLSPLCDVIRVVDGDTIVVFQEGQEITVRLIGIDTPESVNPDESLNTAEGKEASEWMKELLTGAKVYLEYDAAVEDDYGRTLAYVYLEDGETMVNRLLLTNGLATIMTVQPNSKYENDFSSLQNAAREAGAGFWKTGFFQ